jgi:uracil-DNA glycosylase
MYRPINLPVLLGGGDPNGIMFIGSAPNSRDEQERGLFSSSGGQLLLKMVRQLQIQPAYYTNLVACRSCAPMLDDKMQERRRTNWRGEDQGPMLADQPPNIPQMTACRQRLIEEVYIVDPVVIVALGQHAASALAGASVKLSNMVKSMMITVPGVGFVPSLSAKKQVWKRKFKGVWQRPVEPFPVGYHMIPTVDPEDANNSILDYGRGNSFDRLSEDLKRARAMYRRYHEEVTGIVPTYYTDPDLRNEEEEEPEDGG